MRFFRRGSLLNFSSPSTTAVEQKLKLLLKFIGHIFDSILTHPWSLTVPVGQRILDVVFPHARGVNNRLGATRKLREKVEIKGLEPTQAFGASMASRGSQRRSTDCRAEADRYSIANLFVFLPNRPFEGPIVRKLLDASVLCDC
jgi:hypothetical protein